MRTNVPANGQRGSDAGASPGTALLELLRRGTLARLLPLAGEVALVAPGTIVPRHAGGAVEALHASAARMPIPG